MSVLTKVSLMLKHVQFVGLLNTIDVPFPSVYFHFTSFANVFNVDPTFVQSFDSSIPLLSFRLEFVALAIAFPLILMIFTMLVFIHYSTLQWGVFFVTGVFLGVMKVIFVAVPESSFFSQSTVDSELYTILMASILGYCVLYRVVGKLTRCREVKKIKQSPFESFFKFLLNPAMLYAGSLMGGFSIIAIKVVFCVAMLMCLGRVFKARRASQVLKVMQSIILLAAAVAYWLRTNIDPSTQLPPSLAVPGYILIVMSLVGWLLNVLTTNDDKKVGQYFIRFRNWAMPLIDKGLLAISFFFLSIVFVPITTACLQMYVCRDFTCPQGTKFNPFVPTTYIPNATQTDQDVFCDPCQFLSSCAFNSSVLCAPFDEQRLRFHPDTRCDDSGAVLFNIAAAIVLFVFIFVISLMYFKIIADINQGIEIQTALVLEKMNQAHAVKMSTYKVDVVNYDDQKFLNEVDSNMQKTAERSRAGTSIGDVLERTLNLFGKGKPELDRATELQNPLMDTSVRVNTNAASQPPNLDDFFGAQSTWNASALGDPFAPSSSAILPDPFATSAGPTSPRVVAPLNTSFKSNVSGQASNNSKAAAAASPKAIKPSAPQQPTIDRARMVVNASVKPRASPLYSPFTRSLRLFVLFQNAHQLALVCVSVFFGGINGVSSVIQCGLHLVMFTVLFSFCPYAHEWEQRIAVSLSFSDVIGAAYTILLWQLPTNAAVTSFALAVTILVLTGVLPFVGVLAMTILELRSHRESTYQIDEHKRKLKEKEDKKIREKALLKQLSEAKVLVIDEDDVEAQSDVDRIEAELAAMRKRVVTPEQKLTKDLDDQSKRTILCVFSFFAIPLLLGAMGIATYATIYSPPDEFVYGSSLIDRDVSVVLGGEPSWASFTSDCCCLLSVIPPDDINITERWVCAASIFGDPSSSSSAWNARLLQATGSDVTVTRNRQAAIQDDGIPIRGVCSKVFELPCTANVTDSNVELECATGVLANHSVTSVASQVLW